MATKTKPASRPPTTRKTKGAKASGKRGKAARSSSPSSRARAAEAKPATRKSAAIPAPLTTKSAGDEPDLSSEFPVRTLGRWKGVSKGGRPKNTPDVWTPAHLAEVAGWIYEYADQARYPSVAEFCMVYGITHSRLGEFEELRDAREYLHAKVFVQGNREAMTATKETGPRVTYINKRLANTGSFSLVEKSEVESKSTVVTSYAIPDNGRDKKGRG